MIKYGLSAAVAALAFSAPAVGHAQMAQPMQQPVPNTTTNASATVTGQPEQPGPNGQAYEQQMPPGQYGQLQYGQPMLGAYMLLPVQPQISPRTTWIPGQYNWDPNTSNYVWTDGQYVEAPTTTAQWIPGHWEQTPTSWIWIDGRWN